jgi:2'-5' RNA ligase
MTTLYTVAYPFLDERDRSWIESFRAVHDAPKQQTIAAHFTLVFGHNAQSNADFLSHTESIVSVTPPIAFCFRYAMLCADLHSEAAYVFLVPDEGYAAISRLHDRLYTGLLASSLRLDFPYIPHITIGVKSTRDEAKKLCEMLNEQHLEIKGAINTVSVGAIKDGAFANVARYQLRG